MVNPCVFFAVYDCLISCVSSSLPAAARGNLTKIFGGWLGPMGLWCFGLPQALPSSPMPAVAPTPVSPPQALGADPFAASHLFVQPPQHQQQQQQMAMVPVGNAHPQHMQAPNGYYVQVSLPHCCGP